MKTYEEVINHLANYAFSNLMGGAMNEWYGIDFDMTAFIFDKNPDHVSQDASNRLREIRREYSERTQRTESSENKTKSLKDYLPESFITELGEGPSDSISPVNGGNASDNPTPENTKFGTRDLKVGDPVTIKNMKYEGKTGTVDNFTDDKHVVIVDLGKDGRKKFHVSDLQYDDYANDQEKDFNHALNNLKTLSGY